MHQDQNRAAVVDYFRAGEKGASQARPLGVELEHFLVRVDPPAPVSYEPHGDLIGVRDVLEHLSSLYPERTLTPDGDLVGLAGPDGSITIEPAAQLEISLAPFERVAEVRDAYERFRSALDPYLDEHGVRAVSAGYHPFAQARDLELIPKDRYRIMDAHFSRIGSHGERMMRASASLQVSVDYADEADAVLKMRVASALAPVLAAIADNTATFEGGESAKTLARLRMWRDVDSDRCGVVPGVFDEGFGYGAYADWVLGTSPIFVDRPEPREVWPVTAREAYAGAPMTTADVEHVLSMFWPDVRLKRFVEIRPADCLPAPLAYGYVALVKGVFYSPESLRVVRDLLTDGSGRWTIAERDVEDAITAIATSGLDAEVYGRTPGAWVDLLFSLAAEALPADERPFLEPLRLFSLGGSAADRQ